MFYTSIDVGNITVIFFIYSNLRATKYVSEVSANLSSVLQVLNTSFRLCYIL